MRGDSLTSGARPLSTGRGMRVLTEANAHATQPSLAGRRGGPPAGEGMLETLDGVALDSEDTEPADRG